MQEHHYLRQRFGFFIASHEFCRQYSRDDKCSLARLSKEATLAVGDIMSGEDIELHQVSGWQCSQLQFFSWRAVQEWLDCDSGRWQSRVCTTFR